MSSILGGIGVIGSLFTHQWALYVWMYYVIANNWEYPMFMLFLVTFPLMLVAFGIFCWRTIRLESLSFPSMAMFFYIYFPTGLCYALNIILTLKCLTWPKMNLTRFMITSVPIDFFFMSWIPMLVLRRPFSPWPIVAFFITIPVPWIYNFMSYSEDEQEWTWYHARYGNEWEPWLVYIFIRFFLILGCALCKLGLLLKSRFKYTMIERLIQI